MCIAIGVPMGVAVPSEEVLRICFENNDDGAGFAFAYNNMVHIKKGFMDFESFWNAFHAYDQKYNFKDLGVLIHFRIATHGGRDCSMTHPFPINSDDGALKKIEYHSDYAIVHNGIISLTSSEANRSTGLSDTAIFVRDYLTPLSNNNEWFHTKSNIELIYKLIGSKMAILNNRGEIIFTNGFTEDNGVMYSNSTYKENRVRRSSYSGYYSTPYSYQSNYGYSSGYNYNKNVPQIGGTTEKSKEQSTYISLCKIEDGLLVSLKDDISIETASDEYYAYFFDEDKNLYMGCIDNSIAYTDSDFPYYWWQYTKLGKIDKFEKDNKELKINWVRNTLCYPDQIIN